MIGSLYGEIAHKKLNGALAELVVECHGVGYRVTVPARSLPEGEGEVRIWTHTYVREDALALFGFGTVDERDCFEVLIAAHGIGPSMALGILAKLSPAALATALATKSTDALTAVPGVGKKTAERMVMELAGKLDGFLAGEVPPAPVTEPQNKAVAEVVSALVNMGYSRDRAKLAVADLDQDVTLEEGIRTALGRAAA
jgi:Holliday junction DNA helicase RuvA